MTNNGVDGKADKKINLDLEDLDGNAFYLMGLSKNKQEEKIGHPKKSKKF